LYVGCVIVAARQASCQRESMNPRVTENKAALVRAYEGRSLKVDSVPFYYALHPTMSCNQRCIMCTPSGRHPATTLPFDPVASLLEQFQPFAEHVTLTGGEPLLYPQICELIESLSASKVAVSITTNATMLRAELAERLVGLCELNLKCSIDAATRSTYLKIRGTDHFDRVLANLATFASAVRNEAHVKLILVYVVMRENLSEVLPFIDLARTLDAYRVEFHPVRHVAGWSVSNGTGWVFHDREQCCQFFRDEYDAMMDRASAKCKQEGLRHEVLRV
jgi:molybdenum cofactor biosynthesis enzyme MoaA